MDRRCHDQRWLTSDRAKFATMIEVARYLLALAVVQTHLYSTGTDWTGQIAVFGFYTLSGYLMTRVLNERYGFEWRGTGAFVLNRILRLWPAYCVLFGLATIAACFLPLQRFYPSIRVPQSPAEIITNITVIGQVTFDYLQGLTLAKPLVTSWSLSIELCSYVLLALYFARTPARLLAFAALGIIGMVFSTGYCALGDDAAAYGPYCFQNRYGVIQAGFVPFAFGGLFYFHDKAIALRLSAHPRLALGVLLAAFAAMFSGPLLSATIGPFLGIPAMWMLLDAARDAPRATKAQDFVGRASYHLFIGHMPIAAVLVIGIGLREHSRTVAWVTVVIALVLSVGLVAMERRIDRLRRKIAD